MTKARESGLKPRVYSYIRFSTPEQLKGDSLRRQLKMSEDWCERNGCTLDHSLKLHDLGVSAFKGRNATHGKLAAFLDAVDQGRVPKGSVLLVESLDRLTRNQVGEALELFLGILRRGIRIVTLTRLNAGATSISSAARPCVVAVASMLPHAMTKLNR